MKLVGMVFKDLVHTTQKIHYLYLGKKNRLMHHGEIIVGFSEDHTEHTGTTSQQNAGIFKVRTVGTCSSRCASNGQYFLGICKKYWS